MSDENPLHITCGHANICAGFADTQIAILRALNKAHGKLLASAAICLRVGKSMKTL